MRHAFVGLVFAVSTAVFAVIMGPLSITFAIVLCVIDVVEQSYLLARALAGNLAAASTVFCESYGQFVTIFDQEVRAIGMSSPDEPGAEETDTTQEPADAGRRQGR